MPSEYCPILSNSATTVLPSHSQKSILKNVIWDSKLKLQTELPSHHQYVSVMESLFVIPPP